MANLDKEIQILMLKGEKGRSSYEEAVENEYFSGTLEEWIETYATPENYVTRNEFKKVTQAEYDALEEAGELIPNCYYVITDDDTWEEIETRLTALEEAKTLIEAEVSVLQSDVNDNTTDITNLKANSLMARSLITLETPDDYEDFDANGQIYFTVDNLDVSKNEKLVYVTGRFKINSTQFSQAITIILDGDLLSQSQTIMLFNINAKLDIYKIVASYNNGVLTISGYNILLNYNNSSIEITQSAVTDASFKLLRINAIQQWK